MHRLRSILLALLAGCGSPALPSGAIACGPEGNCPDGMTCVRDLCWSDPAEAWDAATPDASGPDARVLAVEHTREAEAYDRLSSLPGTAGSAEWTEEDEIPGAVGSYLMALPNSGVNCLDEPPTDCGAVVVYQLPAMAPATYHLHLRSSAAGPDDDSLSYGIDGEFIDDADLPDGAAWAWRGHLIGRLEEVPRQLYLWVREDGAAIDRLVVSQSMTPPE